MSVKLNAWVLTPTMDYNKDECINKYLINFMTCILLLTTILLQQQ